MATLAICAELTAMYVCMAIGTMGTNVLEDQTGMALGATDLLMHAAQGITGVIVIELRI